MDIGKFDNDLKSLGFELVEEIGRCWPFGGLKFWTKLWHGAGCSLHYPLSTSRVGIPLVRLLSYFWLYSCFLGPVSWINFLLSSFVIGHSSFNSAVGIERWSQAELPQRNRGRDQLLEKAIERFLVDWVQIVDVGNNP